MNKGRSYLHHLQDILAVAELAQQFVADFSFEAFRKNREKVFAVVHALEIIGEAARHVPDTVRIGGVTWQGQVIPVFPVGRVMWRGSTAVPDCR